MNAKIRAQIFERVCTITGKPRPIQYAVDRHGTVYRRFWTEPVIRGRVRRDGSPVQGRWDSWAAIDGSLPKEARATGKFALIPSRKREDASVKLLRDVFNGVF